MSAIGVSATAVESPRRWRGGRLLLGKAVNVALRVPLVGPLLAETIAGLVARGCAAESLAQGYRPNSAPAVLALTGERFRGDLTCLANSGRVRVLLFSSTWHGRINSLYWTAEMADAVDLSRSYYSDERPHWLRERQAAYRAFLDAVLPRVCKRLGVAAVLSPSLWYFHAFEIGAAAQAAGVPYVVLHREGLVTASGQRAGLLEMFRSLGTFRGSMVVVHNEVIRTLLSQAGHADAGSVRALGAVRMDDYLARIERWRANPVSRRQVAFFSFLPGAGRVESGKKEFKAWPKPDEPGLHELFRSTHCAIAQLAREMPDVQFVIKPKWRAHWVPLIERLLAEGGFDLASLPNLAILPEANAHDLILDSQVVCGFASTVLLEAGVAGKPVIVPQYAEAASAEYRPYLYFSEDPSLFDVADSEAAFAGLIRSRLGDAAIPAEMMGARRDAFAKYVSPLDGKAGERYVSAIVAAIEQGRSAATRVGG